MPDHIHAGTVDAFADLPCEIALPADEPNFFDKRGPLPRDLRDRRRYPRFYFRTPAAIQYLPTFTGLERSALPCRVYMKDLARGSVCFLHSEPVYPRERLRLLLHTGAEHTIEVARCSYIQDRCYEVAAWFYDEYQG